MLCREGIENSTVLSELLCNFGVYHNFLNHLLSNRKKILNSENGVKENLVQETFLAYPIAQLAQPCSSPPLSFEHGKNIKTHH